MPNKLNTVEIGDKFENESYDRIIKALKNSEFAFPIKYSKVIKKPKYLSQKTGEYIEFDLSIEIWPPDADRFSFLFLIECKSYSNKKVPTGDMRKFSYDVNDVAELNGKAVFITNSRYTKPSIQFAKTTGMMLIEVNRDESHNYILHSKNRFERSENRLDHSINQFDKFINCVFKPTKIQGLKRLSSDEIESITYHLLTDFNPNIFTNFTRINLNDLISFFKGHHDLKFDYTTDLNQPIYFGTIGHFNVTERLIQIDPSIVNTERFSFTLAHEIGHSILHSELIVNQEIYDDYEDSKYDIFSNRHILKNDKNWIEWQANRFAASLLMPKQLFIAQLAYFQKKNGVRNIGQIYLDDQHVNRQDFYNILTHLNSHFGTSKTSIVYRLEQLDLISYGRKSDDYKRLVREFDLR